MLSLRDPEGGVFGQQGRIFRWSTKAAAERMDALLASRSYARLQTSGRLVDCRRLEAVERDAVQAPDNLPQCAQIFEHRRIEFPSYPFEWHPLMLADAALASIDIAKTLLADGFTLKDATPYNMLFEGHQPILVDILSIEHRAPGTAHWLPEAQFIRTFLLPLLVCSVAGTPPATTLLNNRDGISPGAARRLAGARGGMSRDFWLYVLLPALLEKSGSSAAIYYHREPDRHTEKGDFVYSATLSRLAAATTRLRRKSEPGKSDWSDYTDERSHYDEAALASKKNRVAAILDEIRPRRLLDVGANTGEFSVLAAERGCSVVALESDLDSLGHIYQTAYEGSHNILPLHMNYAAPTPATGWENAETLSFRERARGHFDCVMMLAVVHHLIITEAIPLTRLIEEAARSTRAWLLIEHVAPDDAMVQKLLRGREFLSQPLQKETFESAIRTCFEIQQVHPLESATRSLYLCRKRSDS